MNFNPIHPFTVENGSYKLEDVFKFQQHLKSLDPDKKYMFIIRKHRNKRSNPQNNYYWGVIIKMIEDETGQDKETVHRVLSSTYLTFYTEYMNKPYIKSTTELSTVEFEEYNEKCRRWASIALDLYIPLPNEVEIPSEYQRG